MTKVLDCTLRDGGYYNDWNFPIDIAQQTVSSLHSAGVDIIEVGLKSAVDEKCSGLFKYCNEEYLDFLRDFTKTDFSYMLNVKEFIVDGSLNKPALDQIILDANQSVFAMCRLATHYADINILNDFHAYFQGKGYQVGINLMGVSLLDDEQLGQAMTLVETISPDVFYVADSFGSMTPEHVSELYGKLKTFYNGPLGIHTHNNQGLAFANSLRAIADGFEYIDATITGMGRGAGNLATEQILLWLQSQGDSRSGYQSDRVLEIIHNYFAPLQERHKWGFNYAYMLSGLRNIHPVYCMELCDGNKFSMGQISGVLNRIPREKRSTFDERALKEAVQLLPDEKSPHESSLLPTFTIDHKQGESQACLIVSTGENVKSYQVALENLIKRRKWPIIECNDSQILGQFPDRLAIIFNQMRLNDIVTKKSNLADQIVTGEPRFDKPTSCRIFHFPYEIGELNITKNSVTIPDYEAGQYAIAIAVAIGFQDIYLAGFSGYPSEEKNQVMDKFFDDIHDLSSNPSLIAITPSHYKSLSTRSIFTL